MTILLFRLGSGKKKLNNSWQQIVGDPQNKKNKKLRSLFKEELQNFIVFLQY